MSNKLDRELVTKAVKELIKFDKQASNNSKQSLLDKASTSIFVQLQLVNEFKNDVLRPVRVKIPHTMFSPDSEEHSVCLFCKSEEKENIQNYLERNAFDGLTEIISLNEVSKNFKSFKDRKELFSRHTHFVCDSAIANHLYNLLGKVFRDKGHLPIPLEIGKLDTNNKFIHNLTQVVNSTYIYLKGSHVSIKLGNTSMPIEYIVNNIVDGCDFAIEHKIQEHWKNISSIHIKTPTSSSLPLYYKNNNEFMNLLTNTIATSATTGSVNTTVTASKDKTTSTKTTKLSTAATTATAAVATAASMTSSKSNKRNAEMLESNTVTNGSNTINTKKVKKTK